MDVAEKYPWSGGSYLKSSSCIAVATQIWALTLQLAELTLKLLTASEQCACALP